MNAENIIPNELLEPDARDQFVRWCLALPYPAFDRFGYLLIYERITVHRLKMWEVESIILAEYRRPPDA